jgi:hypothetical protein
MGQSACRHQWDLVWYGNWHKGEPRLRCRYCGRWQFELNDEDALNQEVYERSRAAYRIECPTCGALPNFKCLTKNGYPTMHKARKDAANA